jgi:hypothetical protein
MRPAIASLQVLRIAVLLLGVVAAASSILLIGCGDSPVTYFPSKIGQKYTIHRDDPEGRRPGSGPPFRRQYRQLIRRREHAWSTDHTCRRWRHAPWPENDRIGVLQIPTDQNGKSLGQYKAIGYAKLAVHEAMHNVTRLSNEKLHPQGGAGASLPQLPVNDANRKAFQAPG